MKKIRQISAYPVIPNDAADPANQKGNLKRAQVELKKRFERINKAVKQLCRDQKQYQSIAAANSNRMSFWQPLEYFTNSKGELDTRKSDVFIANKQFYSYDISTERYDYINSFIERLLYSEILESLDGRRPQNWFCLCRCDYIDAQPVFSLYRWFWVSLCSLKHSRGKLQSHQSQVRQQIGVDHVQLRFRLQCWHRNVSSHQSNEFERRRLPLPLELVTCL